MNKKIAVLISSLLLLAASVFAAPSISGKKYMVTNVNGQDMIAYSSILSMYISFTDDELILTVSSMGESEDVSEKYVYNKKTGILEEYTLEGSIVKYTISEIKDGIRMTSIDGTSVMDLTETDKLNLEDNPSFLDLLNNLSDDVDEANQWLLENSSPSEDNSSDTNDWWDDEDDEEEFDYFEY